MTVIERPKKLQFKSISIVPVDESGERILRADPEDMFIVAVPESGGVTLRVTRALYERIPHDLVLLDDVPNGEDTAGLDILCTRGIRSPEYEKWVDERGITGTVYFIVSPETGVIKIGYTGDFHSRLSAYRGHSGGELETYIMPGNRYLERVLKTRFACAKKHGEWFYPHPALVQYIWDSL